MLSDRPILATLAYYDGFRWPLTIAELHERLIPSGRLEVSDARPDIGALVARVDALVRSGQVRSDLGLYALAREDDGIFARRGGHGRAADEARFGRAGQVLLQPLRHDRRARDPLPLPLHRPRAVLDDADHRSGPLPRPPAAGEPLDRGLRDGERRIPIPAPRGTPGPPVWPGPERERASAAHRSGRLAGARTSRLGM